MFCPMMWCDWQIGDLTSTEGGEIAPEDNLVTQFAGLIEHLQEDHGAVIGGKR